MKTTENKVEETQGVTTTEKTKKRQATKLEMLKTWKRLGANLIGSGLLKTDDENQFRELYKKAKIQYEGEDIF